MLEKMPKLKDVLSNIFLFTGVVIFEILLSKFSLPLTVLDVMLGPLILILILFFVKRYLREKEEPIASDMKKHPFIHTLGYLLFSITMFVLGVWCSYEGAMEPLGYFSGVKGALHGYTLILVGLIIVLFSVVVFYTNVKNIYGYFKNNCNE